MIDEVASIEKVEAELDAFIESRARQNEKANAEEVMWKAGVRRYRALGRAAGGPEEGGRGVAGCAAPR